MDIDFVEELPNVAFRLRNLVREVPALSCADYLRDAKERWKTTTIPIKMAVIGDRGVGKSTFIGAFFGLSAEELVIKRLEPTETRNEIEMYTCPGVETVTCFELPGFDQLKVSKEEYCQKVDFYNYDVYLVLSNVLFKDNDLWCGEEARRNQKHVFFVLSKALANFDGKPTCRHPEHWDDEILSAIYIQCAERMPNPVHRTFDTFLIDAYQRHLFDFDRLDDSLAAKFIEIKRQAFTDATVSQLKTLKEKELQQVQNHLYQDYRFSNFSYPKNPFIPTIDPTVAAIAHTARHALERFDLLPSCLSSLSDLSGTPFSVLVTIVNQSVPNLIDFSGKKIEAMALKTLFDQIRSVCDIRQRKQSNGWLSYIFPTDDPDADAPAVTQILAETLDVVLKNCVDSLAGSLDSDYKALHSRQAIYVLDKTVRAFSYGAQGQLYIAQLKRVCETTEIAVKVVQLDPDEHTAIHQTAQLDSMLGKLANLRHKNVVLHYSPRNVCCQTDISNIPGVRPYHIAMEFCLGGTLQKAARHAISSNLTQNWTRQIAEGLVYLHCAKIVHRDLKGANIFLSTIDYDTCIIKIGDMGDMKKLMTAITKRDEITGYRGTVGFMSPEMIRGNTSAFNTGRKTDIWSLGCVVVEMVTGTLQFCRSDGSEIIGPGPAIDYFIVHEGGTPLVPSNVPQELNAFIRSCFDRNPDERPTAKQLLTSPFLQMPDVPQWLDSRPARP